MSSVFVLFIVLFFEQALSNVTNFLCFDFSFLQGKFGTSDLFYSNVDLVFEAITTCSSCFDSPSEACLENKLFDKKHFSQRVT